MNMLRKILDRLKSTKDTGINLRQMPLSEQCFKCVKCGAGKFRTEESRRWREGGVLCAICKECARMENIKVKDSIE